MSFESLGLAPELLRAVAREGYIEPTAVQAEAIPHVLARRDVLAGAQTGTGKTAAFVLPILQLLHSNRPAARHPIRMAEPRGRRRLGTRPMVPSGLPIRCLVLTPTRELALQVEEFVRVYGKERPIRSTIIYGGVGYETQLQALRAGPEIVVATPGRLLDIHEQGRIDLRQVEILVLDEADRMLDMGFIPDIRRILALLPPRRQNLLFSATFADDVRRLAATLLHDPVTVQVARRNAPIELVRQVVVPVDKHRKRELLSHLIRSGRIDRALVFARTKYGAGRLAEQLARDGISAGAIHGDRTQGQRVRVLDDFKEGRVSILVATEVAARGLDIDGLPHVVNFELPTVTEDYVHRIGRTGRAGMEGDAISLVCLDELDLLHDIERMLQRAIPREFIPGFEPDSNARREPIHKHAGARGRHVVPRGRGHAPAARPAGRRPARAPQSRPQPARYAPAARTSAPQGAATSRDGGEPRSFMVLPGERLARAEGSS